MPIIIIFDCIKELFTLVIALYTASGAALAQNEWGRQNEKNWNLWLYFP